MNSAAKWFGRVTWVGILANFGLGIPALIAPNALLARFSLPPANPTMWPMFAAWLLMLLSLFYMPGANDPIYYRINAWLAVFSRLAGVIFFCGFHRDYIMFGLFDLTFLIPEFILLLRADRD